MFERFSRRARQVIVFAQEEARALDHAYIGTEHLVLGLVREEDGSAMAVLGVLGISPGAIRERVLAQVEPGEQAPEGNIPFTRRAKKVLEHSLREAIAMRHYDISTAHLLLGLLREGGGIGARALEGAGVQTQAVRDASRQFLSGPPGAEIRDRRKRRPVGGFGGEAAGGPFGQPTETAQQLARIETLLHGLADRVKDVEQRLAALDGGAADTKEATED
ncbi:ClpA/ClpB-like protein [Murinocardiopsis flavida]|uniref:ClpA/ClpB-like protein n=1 Tax=Murinocardiopsis flavida TaxID=645275 RepID=A0A2P8DUY6_9ACTN|nr:Clp protease N-terminal domain-containing protein [Murinocardiopsis flavida]PSL01043.1 ClpA/ClpB-like protein [Murinocardiopsis flavida]